jgi:hypothetical protein
MPSSTLEPLTQYEPGKPVPLPDLARTVGMTRGRMLYALEHGLLKPEPRKGSDGRNMISWEQAVMLCAAVVLAAAAGMAVVTALKALKGSGATVGPTGIVIPLAGVR